MGTVRPGGWGLQRSLALFLSHAVVRGGSFTAQNWLRRVAAPPRGRRRAANPDSTSSLPLNRALGHPPLRRR